MNHEFNAKQNVLRGSFACAAVFATLTIAASIDLLSRHYGADAQLTAAAAAPIAVVANNR